MKDRPLAKQPILYPWLVLIFNHKSILTCVRLLRIIHLDFFWLQFRTKFHPKSLKVTHVDHPLDDKVPFTPTKIDTYLGFINFWVQPLSFILRHCGIKQGIPICKDFLKKLGDAYMNAASVYRHRMSTTNRPHYIFHRGFFTIHTLDPHLLCVPSLHIAICILTWSFFRDAFQKIGLSEEQYTRFEQELYHRALDISETVLYVKQHSVNCIPAALYMMTMTEPDLIGIEEITLFIEHLFAEATDIQQKDVYDIHEHILFTYEIFLTQGKHDDTWQETVCNWLNSYVTPEK